MQNLFMFYNIQIFSIFSILFCQWPSLNGVLNELEASGTYCMCYGSVMLHGCVNITNKSSNW